MYLPNNPIYQRATDNLRAAFSPIWAVLDELVLTVAETDFVWEEQVVYHQPNKSESLAWGLFKDGMRSLTLRRGAEQEELTRFLEMINRARYLPADAGDDLLTLLWEQEFQYIQYQFVEFFGEGGGAMPEQTGSYPTGGDDAAAQQRREQVAEEAPPKPKGVVDLEDFDSTLYFLDESEIHQVAAEVEDEYRRDVRTSALNVLFDLFELQGDAPDAVRDPRASSTISSPISSTPATSGRRPRSSARPSSSPPAARASPRRSSRGSTAFVAKLSEPAIVRQLLQSLDETPSLAGEEDVAEVLRELRATALEPVAELPSPRSRRPGLKTLLEGVADRLASSHSDEVLRILRSPESRGAGVGGGALRPTRAASRRAGTGEHRDPPRPRRAARLGAGAGSARHSRGARAGGQGDRGRRPRGPPGRGAGGRRRGATKAR